MKKIFLILLILFTFTGCDKKVNNDSDEHFKEKAMEIKRIIDSKMPKYIEVSKFSDNIVLSGENIITYLGISKDDLLDVDNETMCDVSVNVICSLDGDSSWKTSVKCKDYSIDYD